MIVSEEKWETLLKVLANDFGNVNDKLDKLDRLRIFLRSDYPRRTNSRMDQTST